MEIGLKKSTIVIVILLVSGVLGGISIGINKISGTDDENIQKYAEALSDSVDQEYCHYHWQSIYTHFKNVPSAANNIEYYRYKRDTLRIDTYYSAEDYATHTYLLLYDDVGYQSNGESINVSVNPGAMNKYPIDSTYYLIDARNVTYEETDTGWIVYYNNKHLLGRYTGASLYGETVKDGYTYALSTAYFDKEWNLLELEVVERWDSVKEDGEEVERERITSVIYHDTPKEEIREAIDGIYTNFAARLE